MQNETLSKRSSDHDEYISKLEKRDQQMAMIAALPSGGDEIALLRCVSKRWQLRRRLTDTIPQKRRVCRCHDLIPGDLAPTKHDSIDTIIPRPLNGNFSLLSLV